MKLSKYFSNIISLSYIGLSLSGAFIISRNIQVPPIVVQKQQSTLNINSNFLSYVNLGQKRLYSSLLWIATILESDQEHYKGKNLNSWMFLRFKTISELEPKFYENYNFGSLYLSIIKDDIEGASYLYEKGLQIYPEDFLLLKNASYHFYYEAQDYILAKKILNKLKTHPKTSPLILGSLARIESQNGNIEDAFQILLDAYNSITDKSNFLAVKISSQLYAIKSEIDLNCLNNNNKRNCSSLDFDGNKYINVNGKFRSIKEWKPFRIKKK